MNTNLKNDAQDPIASLQYVTDTNGQGWFCEVGIDETKPLESQACTPAEDWVYDRNFGG